MRLEAKIRLTPEQAWMEVRGTRYTLTPGWYTVASLIDALNSCGSPLYLNIWPSVAYGDYVSVSDATSPTDPWTLSFGDGIAWFLGLEDVTSYTPAGDPSAYGNPCAGRLYCELRRAWGMQKKHVSPHSHRACGILATGTARPEDVVVLDRFTEGLALRWLDCVAAGRVTIDGVDYFLLDDSVAPERKNEEIKMELTLVEVDA